MRAPDEAQLYEAALNHLARYAATELSLRRVLERRVDRWVAKQAEADGDVAAAAAPGAKRAVPAVIVRLKQEGLLDDAAFAASRGRRLTNQGKSRRAALAHLAGRGVAREVAALAVAEDAGRELAAACAYLKRRRAGPFGDAPALKTLAAMARAGFAQATCRQALGLTRDEAEDRIRALQDGFR